MRRLPALFVAVAMVLGGFVLVPVASRAASPANGELCGKRDLPETGLQGDQPRRDQLSGRAEKGYNCGVALVGHTDLGGRSGNANMAWAGNCAYVAGIGTGIAVVDVSNPRQPKFVTTLHGAGSDLTIETISATKVGDRAVLVAGRYGLLPLPIGAPMDIYDVRDCAHPKLMSTFQYPSNIHNLTFSPDGTRVYSTLPLQVLDIRDLAHPKLLGNLDDQIPQPTFDPSGHAKYLAHEVWTSPDGNLLYLGGQTPTFSTFQIVDITGWPARPPKVLSQVEGRGHSVRLATINGRTYMLHSEESVVDPTAKGCIDKKLNPFSGPAQPWLSDVTDPRRPIMRISQFKLEINAPLHCSTQVYDGVNASVHYHDVDDPKHTTFAMLSMWNAGVRIVDLRGPHEMKEVGYFNPGTYADRAGEVLDKAWGHIRYLPDSGYLWFVTETGGFWVVELEPQVRAHLGLPAKTPVNPDGAPGREPTGVLVLPAAEPAIRRDTVLYYCTLGLAKAAASQ
ncbi:MAG TPA: hypothetical protein VFA83_12735 [Acidimicrobiales bacterium]|nr:hypothetical protein [Acidimicrobiales bacterium]